MKKHLTIAALSMTIVATGATLLTDAGQFSAGGPSAIHVIAPEVTTERTVTTLVVGNNGEDLSNIASLSSNDENVDIFLNNSISFKEEGIYTITAKVLSLEEDIEIQYGNLTNYKVLYLPNDFSLDVILIDKGGNKKVLKRPSSIDTSDITEIWFMKGNRYSKAFTRRGEYLVPSKGISVKKDKVIF